MGILEDRLVGMVRGVVARLACKLVENLGKAERQEKKKKEEVKGHMLPGS